MRTHVTSIVRACFSALRQIRSVRQSLPQHALLSLVHALVITKLDHCNSVLAGTAGYLQNRLQSVLNAAAWLIFSRRASEHTTPLLRDLHWLRVPERIQFRLCVLAYHCGHGTAPGVSCRRPAADIRVRRPSSSSLCRHDYAAGAANSSGNSWRLRLSGGSSAGVAQSASTDQGRLVAVVFSVADKGPSVSAVIQLTSDYCTIVFF